MEAAFRGARFLPKRTTFTRSPGGPCLPLLCVVLMIVPGAAAGAGASRDIVLVAHPGALSVHATSVVAPGTWTNLTEPLGQPFGRAFAALAFDPVQGLGVMFGGVDQNGTVLGDTWVNDGDHPGRWANFTPTNSSGPPPIEGAALVWDGADHYFVLFGGTETNGTPYGGTWSFMNFIWTDLTGSPRSSPPSQSAPSMVYDAVDQEVVLVGSPGPSPTWTFQAGLWSSSPAQGGLDPRSGAVAVDDPSDGVVVVFGGENRTGGIAFNDTWTFSHGSWRSVSVGAGPPAQLGNLGVFDPRSSSVIVYVPIGLGQTWSYANGTWTPCTTQGSPGPPTMEGASIYFDSVVGYDILLGGVGWLHHVLYDAWGWQVPPAYVDPTLASDPLGTTTWVAVALIVIVPLLLALLWRRPPKPSAASAPQGAPAAS